MLKFPGLASPLWRSGRRTPPTPRVAVRARAGPRERVGRASWPLGLCLPVLTLTLSLVGCTHAPVSPPLTGLSVSVADLQLHLRDDSYRSFNHLEEDGRNVFEVTRWKLERLQRERAVDPGHWGLEDFVVEFARARTLERLHLYRSAAEAYERVAASATHMAEVARASAGVMRRFASLTGPLPPGEEDEATLSQIDARINLWQHTAEVEADPGHASLAREEAESWEILRVSFLDRVHGREEAIRGCERLIQRHRGSKLYPRHLIQLGDLHARRAREIVVWARAQQDPLADTAFEEHFEAALAAYELASEARTPVFRREAQSQIQVILSYHDGVVDGVY